MQINVSARHGHLSPASQSKISAKVSRLQRYFDRLTALDVTVQAQILSLLDKLKKEFFLTFTVFILYIIRFLVCHFIFSINFIH